MQTRKVNGASVKALREALGISNRTLASRAEINPGYLTKIEQGSRQPTPPVMVKLANGLGVPLEAISYSVMVLEVAA